MRPPLLPRPASPAWPAALLLAACSSVPLPPDPATSGVRPPPPVVEAQPAPAAPAAPSAPAAQPPAPAPPATRMPAPPAAPSAPLTDAAVTWPPANALPTPLGTTAQGQPIDAWHLAGPDAADAPAIVVVAPPDDRDAAFALAQAAQRLARGGAAPRQGGGAAPAVWLLALTDATAPLAPAGAPAPAPADTPHDHLLLRSAEARAVARLVHDRAPVALVQLRTVSPWIDAPAAVRLARSGTPALHEFTRRAVDEWLRQPALDALARDGVAVSAPVPAAQTGATLVDAAALRHVAAVDVAGSPDAARSGALAHALVRVVEAAARRAEDLAKVRRYVDQETAARPCGTQAGAVAGAPLRACGWWLAADAEPALAVLQSLGIATERVRVNETRLGQLAAPGASRYVDAAVDLPVGSVFVPAAQPLADLAAAVLEPAAPTGVLAAGLVAPAQLARITAVPSAAPPPAPSAAPPAAPAASEPAAAAPR